MLDALTNGTAEALDDVPLRPSDHPDVLDTQKRLTEKREELKTLKRKNRGIQGRK